MQITRNTRVLATAQGQFATLSYEGEVVLRYPIPFGRNAAPQLLKYSFPGAEWSLDPEVEVLELPTAYAPIRSPLAHESAVNPHFVVSAADRAAHQLERRLTLRFAQMSAQSAQARAVEASAPPAVSAPPADPAPTETPPQAPSEGAGA